jgi:hypothetical protein
MFNGISAEGVDPFYPAVYGNVKDTSSVTEKVDLCIMHPGGASGSFHMHTASPCVVDKSIAASIGPLTSDVKSYMKSKFS